MADQKSFWQTTAEMYTKLFSKPPMTEKLLSRPPFKYLFDVVFALIKTTGFAEGLFSESELDASIYTSKEPKLKFLQKIIDCVQIVNGAKLDVKATKIVAGQEPEKTNEWLQAMFVAATSKKDFRPAVKQVLTGEAPPAPEPKKEEKPKPKEVKEPPKPKESAKAPPKAEVPPEEPPKKPKQAEEKPKKKPKQEEPPEPARPKTPPKEVKHKEPEPKSKPKDNVEKPAKPKMDELPSLEKPRANPNINLGQVDPSQHGAFVKQAVEDIKAAEEKRKKAETTEAEPKPEVKEKSKIKMGRLGGKSKVEKRTAEVKEHMIPKANVDDMEYLRNVIQTMTKTIAPLGKSMDFISEDVETMTKEYEAWRNRSQSAKTQLEEELRRTEDILQPLQDKLAEIEGQIQEQKEKIHNTKSQIFKNEGIIQGLLASVIAK